MCKCYVGDESGFLRGLKKTPVVSIWSDGEGLGGMWRAGSETGRSETMHISLVATVLFLF